MESDTTLSTGLLRKEQRSITRTVIDYKNVTFTPPPFGVFAPPLLFHHRAFSNSSCALISSISIDLSTKLHLNNYRTTLDNSKAISDNGQSR